jgi:hypothetical protein
MCKSSFFLVLYECNPELVVKSYELDFMYIKILYMYKDGKGNICSDLKICLQLVVCGTWVMGLIALFCTLKINFSFAELPQNITPYDNKD